MPTRPNLELLVLDAPWGTALDDPETLMELVQRDVDCGFAEWIDGGLDEVRRRFGRRCAAGRLGLVKKDGADPRLIGDSTISNANRLCRISEKIELPGLWDVEEFISRHSDEQWIAFVLDVKTAHKRIKVALEDQGYSVFTAVDPQGVTRWLVYRTCHFGGSWSAYWWSRVAAGFVRLGHLLLHSSHFLGMCVDDELALFPVSTAPLMASLLVSLASALGLPLSWKKLTLSACVKWTGWILDFRGAPRATLPEDKAARIIAGLQVIARKGHVRRRDLQALVGLLSWFTCGARWLKPWMAVWFHMLLKPALRFQCLDETQLAEVLRVLDSNLRVRRRACLSDVQQGWQAVECSGRVITCPSDLQSCRLKQGRAWVKFLDAASESVRPSRQESDVAEFFMRVVRLQSPVHLAVDAAGSGPAAADAFASGSVAGIGGWFLPEGAPLAASSIIWFSFHLDRAALPGWFVGGDADLETRICALEALAQLVLLAMQVQEYAHGPRRPNVGCIALRQQSDNLGVVCSSAKGLSMKEPLASILQATAVFCMQEHLNLRLSHLAGARNGWADALSRGPSHDTVFWSQLSPNLRRDVDWRSLMQAGRPCQLRRVELPR